MTNTGRQTNRSQKLTLYMTGELKKEKMNTLQITRIRKIAIETFKSLTICHQVILDLVKGALAWYGKLTWESAHAWNLIILCLLIVWGMTFIFMVHMSFYAIPLLIYDVMYDITTIP